MKNLNASCARCTLPPKERICQNENGKAPKFCPTLRHPELIIEIHKELEDKEILEFSKQASLQEKDGYSNRELGYENVRPAKPRVEEILHFIRKMGYQKIGLAFCLGLRSEAKIVEKFYTQHDLEMVSVICKVGRVPKEQLGLKGDEKISVGNFESMCDPIMQAKVLNEAKTDFNILLGLCVGHDSLFFKYAEAPCTVLAVKDRVTGHNPLAAVYTLNSYYRALK